METNQLNLQNCSIAYIDKGEGQPIILLHGFCGSSSYWENVISELALNYRVIVPDLPGHGQSTVLQDNASIEDIAEIMKEFLDSLKLDQVTMFGHSLGGYITLAFAEKFSSRLAGFSLVHSTAFPDTEEAKKGRMANVEKVKQKGIRSLIDGLVPKLFSPEHSQEPYVEIAKEIGYLTAPQGAINTLIVMKNRPDRNQILHETELPVLLIAGEKDQIIPQEKSFSVSKSNIKHSLIHNAGHMSMYENPAMLISEMNEFLSS
ncbi:alpha/beta hydrolase [Bacillus sp. BRMEA1]|uniref:alpha/beta fold hydrolase n=1 Tax=Neobacillus endophyticus TaxID=2738405 RepID=UPI0015653FD4|nr:alpha/beta hydrolase [Neobacillus endophyticus]NRD79630.1 alpha/beta hydrolase [Neobacillus endophyticus]